MKIKVKLNDKKISDINRNALIALHQTGDAVLTEIIKAQVIPFDQGTMQNDQTFVDASKAGTGVVSIVSDTPYARRMYYHPEYNFQTVNNPNAQGRWFDDWVSGDKVKFVHKTYKELLFRLGGD